MLNGEEGRKDVMLMRSKVEAGLGLSKMSMACRKSVLLNHQRCSASVANQFPQRFVFNKKLTLSRKEQEVLS